MTQSASVDGERFWGRAKFENAGIPAVVVTVNTGILDTLEAVKAQTIDEYIENVTSPVMILAETLGTDKAMAEAKAWKSYSEGIIRKVYDRTKNLEEADRKTVYWGNTWGENVLTSTAQTIVGTR